MKVDLAYGKTGIEGTMATLFEKYGPAARICVLPEGPQTVPVFG